MARFLVTGGAGFIGSHLVEALLEDGHRIRVLDDLSSGRRDNLPRGVELIEADIADPDVVGRAFDDVEGCFHLAAIASVERCNRDWLRTHQVNLTGTINIFDAARRARRGGVPVVYASSAAVYGDCRGTASETGSTAPLSTYGADKLACELHARAAGIAHGIPTTGLRFFNVYGPRQNPYSPYSGVIAIFIERLRRGMPIEIFGDGQQVRDFTFIADGIAALRHALAAATTHAPVFNVCTGEGTTVCRLAKMIGALCGTEPLVSQRPQRCGDVPISIGDPRHAADGLAFRARTTLMDGLAATIRARGGFARSEARIVA
ncbi:MAG TPA: NAD-dependent epimerase/dehydratase family protein [Stellaceae bacterium]|nr:NAD-dependent epimerase/dehydratase family protein [Stellaceae bacterium]